MSANNYNETIRRSLCMAKVGRPKQEVTKEQRVTVRFTDEEMRRLSEYAKKHSLKLSETIQRSLDIMYKQENE